MSKAIAALLLSCLFCTLGFGQQNSPRLVDNFRVDEAKPYVYLQVVSIEARKPLEPNEPNTGIRLLLVNNSRLPISIITLAKNEAQKKAGFSVVDEVIPDPWIGIGEGSGGGATGVQPDQKNLTSIIRWPNQTELEIRAAEVAAKDAKEARASSQPSRPNGYNDQLFLGRRYLMIVQPGDSVSFSYPVSHISEMWHLEVPFRLALPSSGDLRPPYSAVALYWGDLSESDRSKIKETASKTY